MHCGNLIRELTSTHKPKPTTLYCTCAACQAAYLYHLWLHLFFLLLTTHSTNTILPRIPHPLLQPPRILPLLITDECYHHSCARRDSAVAEHLTVHGHHCGSRQTHSQEVSWLSQTRPKHKTDSLSQDDRRQPSLEQSSLLHARSRLQQTLTYYNTLTH